MGRFETGSEGNALRTKPVSAETGILKQSITLFSKINILFCVVLPVYLVLSAQNQVMAAEKNEGNTIIVSAEGLADPNADIYKSDKGLMVDDLRRDARRQAVEKAVGAYVDSSTLVENYVLINDKILTKSSGLIKQIIKETSPTLGEDGLMHMFIKAEVFLSDVKSAIKTMSKENRLSLIQEGGNPTISVAVVVKDSKRGSDTPPEASPIAENVLKGRFVNFGYRVWSEDYTKMLRGELAKTDSKQRVADFSVIGEAKFKTNSVTLKASGITLTKHILTSWTVKCINNHTGEEIYFNNKVPEKQSWADEDQAIQAIGSMIGSEFSEDFFKDHLSKPSHIMQMQITGLPDYDTGVLLKKELIGLRPILNVDFRNFNAGGLSYYEIEFAGSNSNIAQIINSNVLKPINAKLGVNAFKLTSQHGNVVNISVNMGEAQGSVQKKLKTMPPASLSASSPERIKAVVKDPKIMGKIAEMSPDMFKKKDGISGNPVKQRTDNIADF
ncbi:MAG: hypothetical protein KJ826_17700 [Proteobacteria bacterium]|nr:hypothetical protein [Pseudomonadota bacterium]